MLKLPHAVDKTLGPCTASWLHLTCLIAGLYVEAVLQRQHDALKL